jgi:hypothetical protein
MQDLNPAAPYQPKSRTSKAAARISKKTNANSQLIRVLGDYYLAGAKGRTVDEISINCKIPIQSAGPRCNDCQKRDWIMKVGRTRMTQWSKQAEVWVITMKGLMEYERIMNGEASA